VILIVLRITRTHRIPKKTEEQKSYHAIRRAIYLSVTYASLIGGTGTITGTTTNMIFKGMANK
jgi:Na+/H+ antiporter NhaD/arsenite permease-like protein